MDTHRLKRQIYRDVKPQDAVEETLTDQMIQELWTMGRLNLRLGLRQESIFQHLTPSAMAQMLEIPEPYRSHAPQFLKELNTRFPKK